MFTVDELLKAADDESIVPSLSNEREQTLLETLITRYQECGESSVEKMLQLTETLIEAESKLDDKQFGLFCTDVKLEKKSSTYRKLHKIGERVERFKPHIDRLPFAWTTIYVLATFSDDEFKSVVDSDILTPTITAKAIRDVVPNTKKRKIVIPVKPTEEAISKGLPGKSMLLDLNSLERDDINELLMQLQALQFEMQFKLIQSETLQQFRLQTK